MRLVRSRSFKMKILLIVFAFGFLELCLAVTHGEKEYAESICDSLIDSDLGFIAGFVRLAFHDCVGGCDGCVDLTNPSNGGLQRYITPLDAAYDRDSVLSGSMSRADFWMTCGAVAVDRGHEDSGESDPAPVVDVLYGRQTCNTIPTNRVFPDAKAGLDDTLAYFADVNGFGFTTEETVALLGAHTLGRARIPNSGFDGPWVARVNSLDNEYYQELLRPWVQKEGVATKSKPHIVFDFKVSGLDTFAMAGFQVENQEGNYQWRRPNDPPNLMVNADMCLTDDIHPELDFGENDIKDTRDIPDSSTIDLVRRFANNNADWLEQFGLVFTKMISKTANGETLEEATGDATTDPTTQPSNRPRMRPGREEGRRGIRLENVLRELKKTIHFV